MKKIIALVAVLLLALLCFTACGEETTVESLPAKTIEISSVEDLVGLKNYLGAKYKNYTFVLKNDIDLTDIEAWEPIGDNLQNAFMGTFNGNEKTITNLKIKGVAEDGTPKTDVIARDPGLEGVTSFPAKGLFGYTANANIEKLTLTGVDFDYYIDYQGYSCAAGLVGFNYGESTFTDISVSGKIKINNLYQKRQDYAPENRGESNGVVDECTTTLYLGSVVGYSQGNTVYKGIHGAVDMDNENYVSYYRTRENADSLALEDTENPFVEGYFAEYRSQKGATKVEKILAGGVVGQIKAGKVESSSYDGSINLTGRTVYAAGIAGAAYGTTLTDVSFEANKALTAMVFGKNLLAGLVANLDDGAVLSDSRVEGVTLTGSKQGSAQKIVVGGAFGYVASLASVENVEVVDVSITAPMKEGSVGGLGGVIRDAFVSDSIVNGVSIVCEADTSKENFSKIGAVLAEAHGNSVVSDTHAKATVRMSRSNVEKDLNVAVRTQENTVYFNEDGKPAIRFYKQGSNASFIVVDAEVEGKVLTVNIYNEELSLLKTATYTLAEEVDKEAIAASDDPNKNNFAAYFINEYFDNGFKNDDAGEVKVEGRDLTGYEYRNGQVVIDNVDTTLPGEEEPVEEEPAEPVD